MTWLDLLEEKLSEIPNSSDGSKGSKATSDPLDPSKLLSIPGIFSESINAQAEDWAALEAAINVCCSARKDSAENLAALLADCRNEPASDWPWWIAYFTNEAVLWTR